MVKHVNLIVVVFFNSILHADGHASTFCLPYAVARLSITYFLRENSNFS